MELRYGAAACACQRPVAAPRRSQDSPPRRALKKLETAWMSSRRRPEDALVPHVVGAVLFGVLGAWLGGRGVLQPQVTGSRDRRRR
jgi:hypothetical protein